MRFRVQGSQTGCLLLQLMCDKRYAKSVPLEVIQSCSRGVNACHLNSLRIITTAFLNGWVLVGNARGTCNIYKLVISSLLRSCLLWLLWPYSFSAGRTWALHRCFG